MNGGLPCLELLESTPAILRGLTTGISQADARWKPADDRFSIAEVLAHLSHSEGHCYRARVDRFLTEELPEFEPDDAQMYLDLYKNADPEEEFGRFEDQRESNIELLRGLAAETGSRKAMHRAAGEITLSQMLHEWALHDLGHVRQVAEPGPCAQIPGWRGASGRRLSTEALTTETPARPVVSQESSTSNGTAARLASGMVWILRGSMDAEMSCAPDPWIASASFDAAPGGSS